MDKLYLGVDVGYGYTKVYGRKWRFKFPSLVTANTTTILDEKNMVRWNGREFYVGTGKKDLRSDRFPFTDEYRALLYFAIAQVLADNPAEKVVVGLGVPPVFKNRREEIRRFHRRTVEVSVGGKKFRFQLEPVVFLQSWGGYIDHIYSLEGRYIGENNTPAIYSDWGFYTIDTIVAVPVWEGGEEKVVPRLPESESPTIKKGVSTLFQLYSSLVAERGATVFPDLRTAERAFLQNKFPEEKRKAVEIWKREVMDEILSRYEEEVHDLGKVVIFGGGANLIEGDFKLRWKERTVQVIKLDEFANARGYFKALPSVVRKREVVK